MYRNYTMTLSAKTHNFHTEVFKVLCTCRQMAKFANEKRLFGGCYLAGKIKTRCHTILTLCITYGGGRFLQQTEVFKVLCTCRQMAKFANEKRLFGGCYLAGKIKTRCHTILTLCITYGGGRFLQQTEVFKVLRTCRQRTKFASENRLFGDVTLHAKFKHVAIQFAHRV